MCICACEEHFVRRAVTGTPFEGLATSSPGPLIHGISTDPVAAAKLLNEFAKGNDKLSSKPAQCRTTPSWTRLASRRWRRCRPSREELRPSCSAPCRQRSPSSSARLNEIPTKFVRGLAAVRDAKRLRNFERRSPIQFIHSGVLTMAVSKAENSMPSPNMTVLEPSE